MSTKLVTGAVLLLAGVVAFVAAVRFRDAFASAPEIATSCINELGYTLTYTIGQPVPADYGSCINRRAQLFLERDYPESKDLAKSFLTLLTALLVASITFSEKIIDFNRASWVSKALMVICWVSILGAIIACGVGLAFMAKSAGWAAYQPFRDFRVAEFRAERLFVVGGVCFGAGLAALLSTGIITLLHRPSPKV